MTTIHRSGLTLDEFLALPEEKPALEYFDGEVTQKVSPLARHARLLVKLGEFVNLFAEPRRLALVFTNIRSTFAGASRVADIGVYRWIRIPRNPDGTIADCFYTPPDIAVEIFSPGQVLHKLMDKCRWYVANGVQIALFVHHPRLAVTRFTLGSEQQLTGDARIDLDAILPGFQLTVRQLFDTLRID
jgi:Uma2 family endonuclease